MRRLLLSWLVASSIFWGLTGEAVDCDLGKIVIYPGGGVLAERSWEDWMIWSRGHSFDGSDVASSLVGLPYVTVDVSRGVGGIASLALDGTSPRQVLVLVEGIPVNSLSSGHFNVNRLPLLGLSRIDALPGALSYLWQGGLGGVVNFSLDLPEEGAFTYLSRERFDGWRVSFGSKISSEDMFLIEVSEHYRSIFRKDRFWRKGFSKWKVGRWNATVFFFWGEVKSGVFSDGSWERDSTSGVGWSLSREISWLDWSGILRLAGESSRTKVEGFSQDEDEDPTRYTRNSETRVGCWWHLGSWITEDLFFSWGGDLELDELDSSYISSREYAGQGGLFLNGIRYLTSDWEVFWGIRGMFSSAFGGSLSGRVGARFRDWEVSVSRVVSPPPLLWRYYEKDLSGISPNPDIEPEKSWRFDAVFSKSIGTLFSRVRLSFLKINDAIGIDRVEGEYIMRNYREFSQQRISGEVGTTVAGMEIRGFIEVNRLFDEESNIERKNSIKDRVGMQVKAQILEGVHLRLRLWREDWLAPESFNARDGNWILDVGLEGRWGKCNWFFKVNNVLGEDFWVDESLPLDKRRWEVGINFSW